MTAALTISSQPPLNPGLDYGGLVAAGLELIQELSGSVWTEYNESDPGITTLEQVCYALTELSYRAELPLEDLLVPRPGGHVHPRRQALYPPRRIFPCNPLTQADYRKLLLDRIPRLANVWLRPHQPESDRGVAGLYDIALYVPGLLPPPCESTEDEEQLRSRVKRVYCRHRNLCEDVRSITFLRGVRTVLACDVSIADSPRPETILANLLFRASMLFAPEPRRRTLQSLIQAGAAPSAIFNGPLLLHGFVDDGELQEKASSIRMPDVVRTVTRGLGIHSVRDLQVRVRERCYSGNESIPVRPDEYLQLDTAPDARRGVFSIRLFRQGIEVKPDPKVVARELDRLFAEQRKRYPLAAQYDQYFGFPSGKWQDVERYYSIQNQFPNVYGINSYGVESGASLARQAQAKQFKGYLMVFDQLLADFLAQLAGMRDLYSLDPAVQRTYFVQSLQGSVPNVEPLLMPDYLEGLRRIAASDDHVVARRSRFVDLLLALYAEKLDDSDVRVLRANGAQDAGNARLLQAKLALLRRMVPVTHNRGRGVDYLERPSRGNVAGMELKIRIQLGMDALDVRPISEVAGELGVRLVADDEAPSVGRALPRYTDLIEEQFTPVSSDAAAPLRDVAIPESILGGSPEELRIGRFPGESEWSLVWRDTEWRLGGKYRDRDAAAAAGAAFASLLRKLSRSAQQLYIVEHTLLRFGRFRERGRDFPYSFSATAVLSPPAELRRDSDYRTFAQQVIRANTPAHIVIDDLFLRPAAMCRFEDLYWAWRGALRRQNRAEIIRTSAAVRLFLELHGGAA